MLIVREKNLANETIELESLSAGSPSDLKNVPGSARERKFLGNPASAPAAKGLRAAAVRLTLDPASTAV